MKEKRKRVGKETGMKGYGRAYMYEGSDGVRKKGLT